VREHRVETSGWLEPVGRFLSFKLDADVEAIGSGGLNDCELFAASDRHVAFLWGEVDVRTERVYLFQESVVDGFEGRLLSGVHFFHGVGI